MGWAARNLAGHLGGVGSWSWELSSGAEARGFCWRYAGVETPASLRVESFGWGKERDICKGL